MVMSSYLHIFPTNNASMRSFVEEKGAKLAGVPAGRALSQQEFDEIVGGVQSSDYQFSEDGHINIRRAYDDDIYAILNKIAKKFGSRIVLNDDMKFMIF